MTCARLCKMMKGLPADDLHYIAAFRPPSREGGGNAGCCLVELWLEWLHDEISMALDSLDREHVYDLFEKAVKDYICKSPQAFSRAPGSVTCIILCCLNCVVRCYCPEDSIRLAIRKIEFSYYYCLWFSVEDTWF